MWKKPKYFTSKVEERKIRKLIREDKYQLEWHNISFYGELSEAFIREYRDQVSWYHICENQELSENFIREFKDKINWTAVSYRFCFSESFLREFKDKIDWSYVLNNNEVYHREFSPQFLKDMQEYLKK